MADEPQLPAEGTPAPETEATPTNGSPEVDWQKRYTDLQAAVTPTQQEAAQLRQQLDSLRTDPEAQSAFLRELGYEIEPDEPEPQFDPQLDPELRAYLQQQLDAQLDARVKPLEQTLSQAEEQRQIQALDEHFNQAFSRYAQEAGGDLSEDDQAFLIGRALTLPAENGMPPVDKAWEELKRRDEAAQQRWASTKRTSYRVSPNGAAGTDTPDLDDPAQRVAWMEQRLADLNAG